MNKEEIQIVRKNFRTLAELIGKRKGIIKPRPSRCIYSCHTKIPCKGIYYHRTTEFKITILNDDSVYQVGTECDIIGVELKTFEDLHTRFKSFTGEQLLVTWLVRKTK